MQGQGGFPLAEALLHHLNARWREDGRRTQRLPLSYYPKQMYFIALLVLHAWWESGARPLQIFLSLFQVTKRNTS
jgi:hypothetical protein